MAVLTCTISGRVYKGVLPAKNTKIKAVKIVHPDELMSTAPVATHTDSNGDFSLALPQGASLWLYGDVQDLNTNGIAGVPFVVPAAASAELRTLVPPASVPNSVLVAVSSFAANFGDGVSTTFTITHGLNSEDLFAAFRLTSGTKESVAGIAWRPDTDDPANKIVISTTFVPTLNQLRVVLKK